MSGPFTARDLELLAAAMQCTKGGEISIDYAKFAVKGKYGNANSAKAGWHALKKKIAKASGEEGEASGPATPAKEGEDSPAATTTGKSTGKSTAKGKKRSAAAAALVAAHEEGEEEEGVEATPSKPKAKTPRKSKKAKQAETEVEAEDDTDAVAALVSDEVEKVKVEEGDEIA